MQRILFAAMLFASLSLAAQNNSLYVAIKSGLNLRESPSVEAKILERIPYNTKIIFSEINEQLIGIKTEGLLGYWRKVSYNNKTGYVVDSYLFPVAPPAATVKTMKDYLGQLSVPFGNKLVVKSGNDEVGWQLDKQLFKNGGEWHQLHGYEYGSNTYFLPDFTLQQAFLLVRMIPEFAQVLDSKDEFPRQNKTLKKGDIDYRIRVESETVTKEPLIKKIVIEFEQGAIYNFELYEVDNQIVIFYGSGV
jgi:hypothetical protein